LTFKRTIRECGSSFSLRAAERVRVQLFAMTDFGPYAQREYERRWLLRALPPQLDPAKPGGRITDRYLTGTRFRVREQRALVSDFVVWKLTQKFPEEPGALDRIVITNNYLTREEYELFRTLPGKDMLKFGWPLKADGRRYVFDVFDGPLKGLILAECEYETHDELLNAPPPPFEGVDVTMMPQFTGGELIGKSFADIADLVQRTFQKQ
jgi:CYTH domain-containing protein